MTETARQKNLFTGEWENTFPRRSAHGSQLPLPSTRFPVWDAASTAEPAGHPDSTADSGANTPPIRSALPARAGIDGTRTCEAADTTDLSGLGNRREALYLALVRLSEEDAETLWIDPAYAGAYALQIALTALEARSAGLTDVEIATAVGIGRHYGTRKKARREGRGRT